MQDTGPRTTETSESEGRMKAGVGCSHGKSKCLKCAMSKYKDGKGGPGVSASPGMLQKLASMGIMAQPTGSPNSDIPGGMRPSVKSKIKKRAFPSVKGLLKTKKATMKGLIFKNKNVKPRKALPKLKKPKSSTIKTSRKPVF